MISASPRSGLIVAISLFLLAASVLPAAAQQGSFPASAFEHWAYQALVLPAPPEVENEAWVRTPIDRFVLKRLEDEGIVPSPEADRRTLIRRVSFDLTGLPPSPAEIDTFLADDSRDAYSRLVERLLASSRYGERWGRHWLDVVHYGETHGFDKDQRRDNAWPYRDYVIESFNEDKPYARFVREQIAGDVLYPDSPEGVVATGFLASGPWDLVGQAEVREGTVEKDRVRVLDRDDIVTNVITAFMSTTVQCARCHAHKFDPVTQEEYYGIQAVFAGVDRGDRPYEAPEVAEQRKALAARCAEVEARVAAVQQQLDGVHTPEVDAARADLAKLEEDRKRFQDPATPSPTNGFHSKIGFRADEIEWVQVDLGESLPITTVRLFPARPTDFKDSPGFGFPVRFFVSVSGLEDFAESEIILDARDGDYPNPGLNSVEIPVPSELMARYVRITATHLWERSQDFVFALAEMQVDANGANGARGKAVSSSSSIEFGRWAKKNLVDGFDSRARVLGIEENVDSAHAAQVALDGAVTAKREELNLLLATALSPEVLAEHRALQVKLAEFRGAEGALPSPKQVYAVKPVAPRPVHVLARGDVKSKGAPANPAGLLLAHDDGRVFEGLDPAQEGQARAALARWVTNDSNALTWRSMANRVWQYHFGRGIVDTPNDFGKMGGAPTHPELLDWLAVTFRDGGGSLKDLHRLIVNSATYRQQARQNPDAAKLDADNRLLWRMNRRRLEAEEIRDTILAVSGKLDLSMGGPSFELFSYTHDHSPKYDYIDFNEPRVWRRAVYRFIVRSVPDPLMESLDCADPNMNVPVRNETLTALQALALLNDPFILNQSGYIAAGLRDTSDALDDQIGEAYARLFARQPSKEEVERLGAFAQEHGIESAVRLLLNTNEFVFID